MINIGELMSTMTMVTRMVMIMVTMMMTRMKMMLTMIRTCGAQTAAFTKDFLDRMATPLAQGHCHDYQVKMRMVRMMMKMMSEDDEDDV